MDRLIIAEKPSVALRIAIALGNNKQKRLNMNGVSYYEIDENGSRVYIAAAVGHIFTIRQNGDARGYPVLDISWSPSYEVDKKAYYTKKYLDVFRMLAHKCGSFINACDFDIEGTVIGTNIIKMLGLDESKAKRMKFSTTTIPDLKNAYENLMPLDMDNFHAGEVRHTLDWLWGINLSRALSSAIAGTKYGRPLSIGRVQGPTLALLARHEIEIQKFVPKPYWNLFALVNEIEFSNVSGSVFEKKDADKKLSHTESHLKEAFVEGVESNEQLVRPYPPFDLTALQLEASRVLRMDPTATLASAQILYEHAYISYPRTSSQKLPPTLGLSRIIGDLAKNPKYSEAAKMLIGEKRFRPNEGMKSDEAHPAIYPTGIMPKDLKDPEARLYDLIVRRFLACFAPYAKLSKTKVIVAIGEERYSANGSITMEKGWLDIYGFAASKDKELPKFGKGGKVNASKAYMHEMQTQPPKRFGKAALIAELEKRTLGTKATRAAVIDTLFRRGYIEGSAIKVTSFGMTVYNALEENANMIVNQDTTRKLEEDMDRISNGKERPDSVIKEGKEMLLEALKAFDSNKEKIGKAMEAGLVESQVSLGKCLKDGGDLIIKRSKAGKQFVSCANYPDCVNTYSIPQNALIAPTGKTCEHCHTPIVKVIRRGKGVFEMDLDPDCVTKQKWKAKREAAISAAAAKPAAAKSMKPKAAKAAAPKAAKVASKKTAAAKKRRATAAKPKKGAKHDDI